MMDIDLPRRDAKEHGIRHLAAVIVLCLDSTDLVDMN